MCCLVLDILGNCVASAHRHSTRLDDADKRLVVFMVLFCFTCFFFLEFDFFLCPTFCCRMYAQEITPTIQFRMCILFSFSYSVNISPTLYLRLIIA